MTQVINRIGDSMLSVLLPKSDAGADCCSLVCRQCHLVDEYCGSDCKTHFRYYKTLYNCACTSCSGALVYCYSVTGGYCCD